MVPVAPADRSAVLGLALTVLPQRLERDRVQARRRLRSVFGAESWIWSPACWAPCPSSPSDVHAMISNWAPRFEQAVLMPMPYSPILPLGVVERAITMEEAAWSGIMPRGVTDSSLSKVIAYSAEDAQCSVVTPPGGLP
jgi:hypothetical protein